MPKRETIGERLYRLRTERGLSQRDVSSLGVSYAYISRVEANARTPSVKAIRKLAIKLGVSAAYLETGSESPIEQGAADAGVEYGSLTAAERRAVEKPPTRPRARALAKRPARARTAPRRRKGAPATTAERTRRLTKTLAWRG